MKKMYFENASLELIRFSADVITSSGGGALSATDTFHGNNDLGNIQEEADNVYGFSANAN